MNECHPALHGNSVVGLQRLQGKHVPGDTEAGCRERQAPTCSAYPLKTGQAELPYLNQRIDEPVLAFRIINLKGTGRPSLDTLGTVAPEEGNSGEGLQSFLVKKRTGPTLPQFQLHLLACRFPGIQSVSGSRIPVAQYLAELKSKACGTQELLLVPEGGVSQNKQFLTPHPPRQLRATLRATPVLSLFCLLFAELGQAPTEEVSWPPTQAA